MQTATEVAASAEEMNQGLTQQSMQIREVTESVSTLSVSASTVAQDTRSAAHGAKSTEAAGDEGSRSVRAAIEQMNEIKASVSGTAQVIESLGKRSETIGDIVAIVNDIADQTNLLAINAVTISQQESFERITRSCSEISAIGEQSASASTESAAAQLSSKSEALQAVVNRFTLERRHKSGGPPEGQPERRANRAGRSARSTDAIRQHAA